MRFLKPKSSDDKKRPASKRTSGRPTRLGSAWRRRLTIAGAAAAFSSVVSLAAFVGFSDLPGQTWHAARTSVLQWTARNGLNVADIQAVGRDRTEAADILRALGVGRTTPILDLDLIELRRRVESLPWVAEASVERRLPHTLRIVISERNPVAISQNGNRSVLIDAHGTEIVAVSAQTADLPIVTGRGAPENVAELIADLAPFPELAARVKAAVRVGDRRWDVRLDSVENGIEVRLPETDSAAAWGRLAEINRKHRLLMRDVTVIDMRVPDRLIVRLANGKTLPPLSLETRKGGQSA